MRVLLLAACFLTVLAASAAANPFDDALTPAISDTTFAFTWVFADSNCGCPPCPSTGCPYLSVPIDLEYAFVVSPWPGDVLRCPQGVMGIDIQSITDAYQAPDSGYEYFLSLEDTWHLMPGGFYLIKTLGGGHAIIEVVGVRFQTGVEFLYRYQPDGSGHFDGDTPVNRVSWGRIKARYE